MGCGCGNPCCGGCGVDSNTLIQRLCNLNVSNLRVVTDCLTVTVAGSWGEIGDTLQVLRWFNAAEVPPVSFTNYYINTRTRLMVTGITTDNTSPCASGGGGGGGDYTSGTATVAPIIAAGSGTVTSGANRVTVQNVGPAAGVVAGVALAIGQSVEFNAFSNPAVSIYYSLPAITYDGTGTSLFINVVR